MECCRQLFERQALHGLVREAAWRALRAPEGRRARWLLAGTALALAALGFVPMPATIGISAASA